MSTNKQTVVCILFLKDVKNLADHYSKTVDLLFDKRLPIPSDLPSIQDPAEIAFDGEKQRRDTG